VPNCGHDKEEFAELSENDRVVVKKEMNTTGKANILNSHPVPAGINFTVGYFGEMYGEYLLKLMALLSCSPGQDKSLMVLTDSDLPHTPLFSLVVLSNTCSMCLEYTACR
jgi:hypothetical protein